MGTRSMLSSMSPHFVHCVAVAIALAVAGCAATAPAPTADADRQSVNQRKQSELEQMLEKGQRNDDYAPIK